MVWFQCEDCGEELKKPKLPNHFRICSAGKLSCLDCGVSFTQETVQGHTQCITEAEKYGPKGDAKSPHSTQSRPDKPKKNADVDIHVGLSSHAPWFCSLCNAHATSRQTLLTHADGKKHRAKARAYHAAQNPTAQIDEHALSKDSSCEAINKDTNGTDSAKKQDDKISTKESPSTAKIGNGTMESKKRKQNPTSEGNAGISEDCNANDLTNGKVVQAGDTKSQKSSKKQKVADSVLQNGHSTDKNVCVEEILKKKIKWKKLASSILRSNPDGAMKIKKLQKLAFKDSGTSDDRARLCEKFLEKINSSSQFVIEGKYIRLAAK